MSRIRQYLPAAETGPLLTVYFIFTLGFSIVLPFLVYVVKDFGGNETVYGLVGATYSGFQLIGAPMMGGWSDRTGRKKMLLLSQLGTVFSWGLFLLAFYLPGDVLHQIVHPWLGSVTLTLPLLLLLLARALDGLTGGNVSVAQAYLADLSDDFSRQRNFGWMGVAGNMGFILGPALAGLLGQSSMPYRLPVMVALAISLLATLYIAFGLPESPESVRQHQARSSSKQSPHQKRASLGFLLRFQPIFRLLLLYFLIFLGFNLFYTGFPVHAAETLNWNAGQLGIFLALLSGAMALVQGPLMSNIAGRFASHHLMIAGSLLVGLNFAFLTRAHPAFIYSAALLFALGNGLMWPSFLALLARVADGPYQGVVQGYGNSAGSLASIVGLILGGVLYHQLEATLFWLSAGVFALVSLLSFTLNNQRGPIWGRPEEQPLSIKPRPQTPTDA